MHTLVTPFTLDVPQQELDDLAARLERTRWPDPSPVGIVPRTAAFPFPRPHGDCREYIVLPQLRDRCCVGSRQASRRTGDRGTAA